MLPREKDRWPAWASHYLLAGRESLERRPAVFADGLSFLCRRFGPAAFVPPAAQRLNAADDVGRSVQEPDGDVITRGDKTASANVSAGAMQSRLRLQLQRRPQFQFQFQFQLSLDMGTAGPSRHTSSRRPPSPRLPLLDRRRRRRRKACPRLYLPPSALPLFPSPPPPSPLDASCDLDRGPSVPDPPLGPPWLAPSADRVARARPPKTAIRQHRHAFFCRRAWRVRPSAAQTMPRRAFPQGRSGHPPRGDAAKPAGRRQADKKTVGSRPGGPLAPGMRSMRKRHASAECRGPAECVHFVSSRFGWFV